MPATFLSQHIFFENRASDIFISASCFWKGDGLHGHFFKNEHDISGTKQLLWDLIEAPRLQNTVRRISYFRI